MSITCSSQNRKIAISALIVFAVSFVNMLVFLRNTPEDLDSLKTDLLHAGDKYEKMIQEGTDVETVYREYVDNHEDPIVVTNVDGSIAFVSDNFCSLVSTKCSKLYGKYIFDLVNAKQVPDLAIQYTHLISSEAEGSESIGPVRMIRGNSELLILMNGTPLMGEEHKVKSVIFTVKDLTDEAKDFSKEDSENAVDDSTADSEDQSDQDHTIPQDKWLKDLYPRIENMTNMESGRLMVDKISFKTD